MNSRLCNTVFDESINRYHEKDDVDQDLINPYTPGSFEDLLLRKNWIDTVQWHLEDIIRKPENSGPEIQKLKQRIDASNQDRTDIVEQIDDRFVEYFSKFTPPADARLNSETPAWVIDRLSILALKIYHMREQTIRQDVDQDHIQSCEQKLNVLLEQRRDLSQSLDELLDDIEKGKRKMKVYRQMKMYNDKNLNPALYGQKSN
ncbi:MAG: DUF4254 domain-containing protein [Leptospiraceae bacterium]|nr:DUF4254 domain-containing protein [Leptospiraceae bacterium]